jgi:hypoxanthine-guanine phosphoribosyltransferase
MSSVNTIPTIGDVLLSEEKIRSRVRELGRELTAEYEGEERTESSGVVRILSDLGLNIEGRHVLIVEDIVDTGLTLEYIRELLLARNPASLKVVTLLDKWEARMVNVPIDYTGFRIPNEFVVGYGLDFAQRYRNLPYITVLDESVARTSRGRDAEEKR